MPVRDSIAEAIARIKLEHDEPKVVTKVEMPDLKGAKILTMTAEGRFAVRFRPDNYPTTPETVIYLTRYEDEAANVFEAYTGPKDWHECYLPVGRSISAGEKNAMVHAVGETPLNCVRAFLDSKGLTLREGSAVPMESTGTLNDSAGSREFQWAFAEFRDDETGTSFKAAGRNVPGGVVMTWWK